MLRYTIWVIVSVVWVQLVFLFEAKFGWPGDGLTSTANALSSSQTRQPTLYVFIYILIIINTLKLFGVYNFRIASAIFFVLIAVADWHMHPNYLPTGFFFVSYFPVALGTWIFSWKAQKSIAE